MCQRRERTLACAGPALLLLLVLSSCTVGRAKGPEGLSPEPEAAPRLLWVRGSAGRLRVEDGGRGGIPVVFV
ncbi:MAG: hypothetical protein AB1347_11525, partial [Acidobacteriota bacterium]